MSAGQRGYVICAEPRSGTTFLCQLLRSTGQLGNPREYVLHSGMARALEAGAAGIDDLLAQASTPNGIYGIKLFSHQFDVVSRAHLFDRLPACAFIHVERRDLLGQAISHVKATQTRRFRAASPEGRPPVYDRRAIERALRAILRDQARWREYFAINAIEPLVLVYEDIVREPGETVEAVARLVGLDGRAAFDPAKLPERQADASSAEWRQRFLDEAGDRNRLPPLFPPGRVTARRLLHRFHRWAE